MAREEDDLDWEWFNEMYADVNPEVGVQFDPSSVNYDLADQTAGRRAYRGWGEGNLTRESQRLRSDYAQKLKMQQKLADELRNTGLGAYLPGGEFQKQ